MISPKEVLKGCILSYEGKAQIVKGVSEYIIFEGKKEWVGGSLINGEPISEKWLEVFGFTKMDQDTWSDGKIDIVLNDGYFTTNCSRIKYQYIHQIQVLSFALTGEHIKLPKLK